MDQVSPSYCSLYIVRHGQTDWNARGLLQGETDIPLNKEGIKQAKILGKSLQKIKFDAIFSSDLVRAKKTAEIIAMERKMAVATTKLLRERRYGKFEGQPYQLRRQFHKDWEKLSKQARIRLRPDQESETDEEAVSRLITFLREVAALYLGKTVLIVTHGGLMRALLNHLSDKTYLTGSVSNSAYIKLESDGVDFFIKDLQGIKNPDE